MKACWFCEHFGYQIGHTYSEYTSDPSTYGCEKGHWSVYDLEDVALQSAGIADECEDFTYNFDVTDYLEKKNVKVVNDVTLEEINDFKKFDEL